MVTHSRRRLVHVQVSNAHGWHGAQNTARANEQQKQKQQQQQKQKQQKQQQQQQQKQWQQQLQKNLKVSARRQSPVGVATAVNISDV